MTLLEQVKQGDRESWERLLKLYRPLVLFWCHRKGIGREDAEDVAQKVYTVVFGQIGKFSKRPRRGTFRMWLRTITDNTVGDDIRRARRRLAAAGGSEAQALLQQVPDGLGDGAAEDEAPGERVILLRRALELLQEVFKPHVWEAAWRTAVEGQAAAEVAADLGMSIAAVYLAKSRVLARLRQELAELLD